MLVLRWKSSENRIENNVKNVKIINHVEKIRKSYNYVKDLVLVNDQQTLPPQKKQFGKIFLAYDSDDFRTKKNYSNI